MVAQRLERLLQSRLVYMDVLFPEALCEREDTSGFSNQSQSRPLDFSPRGVTWILLVSWVSTLGGSAYARSSTRLEWCHRYTGRCMTSKKNWSTARFITIPNYVDACRPPMHKCRDTKPGMGAACLVNVLKDPALIRLMYEHQIRAGWADEKVCISGRVQKTCFRVLRSNIRSHWD